MSTEKSIEDSAELLQTIIGYQFKDINHLIAALTRDTAASELLSRKYELLGDAVMNVLVRATFGPVGWKFETPVELHSALDLSLSNKFLDTWGEWLLGKLVIDRPYRGADFLESLVGAVYRDGGFALTAKVVGENVGILRSHDLNERPIPSTQLLKSKSYKAWCKQLAVAIIRLVIREQLIFHCPRLSVRAIVELSNQLTTPATLISMSAIYDGTARCEVEFRHRLIRTGGAALFCGVETILPLATELFHVEHDGLFYFLGSTLPDHWLQIISNNFLEIRVRRHESGVHIADLVGGAPLKVIHPDPEIATRVARQKFEATVLRLLGSSPRRASIQKAMLDRPPEVTVEPIYDTLSAAIVTGVPYFRKTKQLRQTAVSAAAIKVMETFQWFPEGFQPSSCY